MLLCWAHCTEISLNRNLSSYLRVIWKTSLSLEKKRKYKNTASESPSPPLDSWDLFIVLWYKVPMSCKWLLFLPHHASCWKATRFNGGLQRGCLPVPHRGLCAVTLRLLGLEGGVRTRLGVGREGRNSELSEPPMDLGFFLHPPTFSTFVFSCNALFLSSLFNHVTDKAGPEDNWAQSQNWHVTAGLSEAVREVTWQSGWARTEKTRSLKDHAVPFSRGFLFFSLYFSVFENWSTTWNSSLAYTKLTSLPNHQPSRWFANNIPTSFNFQQPLKLVVIEIFQPSHDQSMAT